ncbi:MAG: hypothetical protein K2L04_08875 [Alistipes sp.]|nr:hypothetical protein [Alistipes sp.]
MEKVKKYVKNLWGGEIFFIYLRRGIIVDALIPNIPERGIDRLFGHGFGSAKNSAGRILKVQGIDLQHIKC